MNKKLCIIIVCLILMISVAIQADEKIGKERAKLHKRAITEWRFKRLNPKLVDLDDLLDIQIEVKPKYADTSDEMNAPPLRYKLKLIPEDLSRKKPADRESYY